MSEPETRGPEEHEHLLHIGGAHPCHLSEAKDLMAIGAGVKVEAP
jgi:hypothetical protein